MNDVDTRPPARILTERLTLRLPEPDDAPAMFDAWSSDPEVTHFLSWRPHERVDQASAHITRSREGWERGDGFVWFLERNDSRAVIGSIAAWPGHGVALGYVLAKREWSRGFMTESVRVVAEWYLTRAKVARVWATCDPDNRASARVLEKAGFELEGTLRRWEERPNLAIPGPHDALCYSRIRSEPGTP